MRLSLLGLDKGPQTSSLHCPASQYFDSLETCAGDLAITAVAQIEGGLLHLDLCVAFPGQFTCDRCGQPFGQQETLRGDFYFGFERAREVAADPDLSIIPKGARELDISQEIRDLVILDQPWRFLCQEDCKGLCPGCGVNLNLEACRCVRERVDPRWQALQNLKKKKSK
jgi:uncharacterized protein